MSYIGNDTTPPTVNSTNPTNNATSVPVTTTIIATFSEKMALSSINTLTFILKKDTTSVSGSVIYDSITIRAFFIPSSNLDYNTTYIATITTGVTDMAANHMTSNYTWSFTTESQASSVPSAPTGVTATAADKQVTITWNAVNGATSYNIYWSTTSGVTKTNGTKISNVVSPYAHTPLTNGTTYYYVVTSVNGYGESSESNEALAMPQTIITTPITLVSGLSFPNSIAVDSTSVYFTESSARTLRKVGINGGDEATIASDLESPSKIAIDSTNAYLSDRTAVKKVRIDVGTVVALASGLSYAYGIALDSTNVYFTDSDGGTVKKVGKNGGTVTTLASGLNWPHDIAVDSTSVYFTESGGGTVKKIGINGGTVETLASGLNWPNEIAVDSTSVYFTTPDSVKKVGINGGTVITIASGLSNPSGIALDSTNVYWTEYDGDTVRKVGINGGAVTTLVSGLNKPLGIAVDTTNVYFTEAATGIANGGTVKKISK